MKKEVWESKALHSAAMEGKKNHVSLCGHFLFFQICYFLSPRVPFIEYNVLHFRDLLLWTCWWILPNVFQVKSCWKQQRSLTGSESHSGGLCSSGGCTWTSWGRLPNLSSYLEVSGLDCIPLCLNKQSFWHRAHVSGNRTPTFLTFLSDHLQIKSPECGWEWGRPSISSYLWPPLLLTHPNTCIHTCEVHFFEREHRVCSWFWSHLLSAA